MATDRTFNAMLNEYLPEKLLKAEMIKRTYLLQRAELDNGWSGGDYIVPFRGNQASSVTFGALAASNDIAEDSFVRGSVTTRPEAWSSMIFNHRDIMEHGKLSEKSFLRIFPDLLEDMIEYFKGVVSCNMLNGNYFDQSASGEDGGADGTVIVRRPERFEIDQKVTIDDDNTAAADYYVIAINLNTADITFSATRGGAAADISAYTSAQNLKFYQDGADASSFTNLKDSLFSLADGGSTNLYGQAKTAYPYLQSIGVSGATVTADNILEKIFDHYTTVKQRGRGNPNEVWMSFKNLASVMKVLEAQKGGYHIVQDSTKVSAYGWEEIEIFGTKGRLKVVAIHEMDDDWIAFLDLSKGALKVASNGFFKKRTSPDGDQYFEVRNTTGYQYIVDNCFFGDLILCKPCTQGYMHTISY